MTAKGAGVLMAAAVLGLLGCAGKRALPEKAAAPDGQAAAGQDAKSSYVVARGDSLWKIAGKDSVHGDPFQWPLLYRQNRDQIQDPDLIEVKQDLSYRKVHTKQEIDEAIRLARETPPYVPHSTPRKSLPVKY